MTDTKFYAIVEFEDGLQIIPNNWLSKNLRKAVWPNFTNNKRYDRAVKLMEEPDLSWSEHNIKKIYGTYCKYVFVFCKIYLVFRISHSYILIF